MDAGVFGKYDFFTGVPDSQLKPLCDWLLNEYGVSPDRRIIGRETTEAEFEALFAKGKSAAFVVRKSALSYSGEMAFDSGCGGKLLRVKIKSDL